MKLKIEAYQIVSLAFVVLGVALGIMDVDGGLLAMLFVAALIFLIGALVNVLKHKKAGRGAVSVNGSNYLPAYPEGTVFCYPGSSVYHSNSDCSQSFENDFIALSEQEAIARTMRRCKKCW